MKAEIKIIDKDTNILVLELETTTEEYAMIKWKEENQISVDGSLTGNTPAMMAIPFDKIVII